MKSETQDDQSLALSFAQLEGNCYCCGKPGHRSPACRHKDRPKEQWAINKATAKFDNADNKKKNGVSWEKSLAQWSFLQSDEHLKETILLDSQSSVDLFSNPNMVEKVTLTGETLELRTNAGKLQIKKKATVPGHCNPVWFDEKAIANVFSLALMEDQYRVTYDSSKESAFIVHHPDVTIFCCVSTKK